MKRPAEDDDDYHIVQHETLSSLNPNIELTSNNFINGTKMSAVSEKVAILDCGAQYGKVIDRRVRELSIETDIFNFDISAEALNGKYKAIILSGGPKSVYSSDACLCDPNIFSLGIPILGICYGFQVINREFGGTVEKKFAREDGEHSIKVDTSCSLFKGLDEIVSVLLTHGDCVDKIADGFQQVAMSGRIVVAIANESRKLYGLQFHPEVDLTPCGKDIFKNFLIGVAGCRCAFTMKNREEHCLTNIRQTTKDKKVLLLCSGGVDSTVCAALLQKALGKERVMAIHIDNGFMRKNESNQVRESLRNLGFHLRVYVKDYIFFNATTQLLDKTSGETHTSAPLCRVTDPEIKRKIIGDTFVNVFNVIIKKLHLVWDDIYLAQGTLRPDLIESASSIASSNADAIKTHHNDTALVRELRDRGSVIEPLRDFHKDEVRLLGKDLGLPEAIVNRHPFPGPGLAIRILCQTEPYICPGFSETLNLLKIIVHFATNAHQESSSVLRVKECFSHDDVQLLYEATRRIEFASTLLPIRTVGVQGDCRSYSYAVALSTNHRPYPWKELFLLARLIPQAIHKVNRITYVFGQMIEHNVNDITPTLLTLTPITVAREADFVVSSILSQSKCLKAISQMPVVLLPVHFDRPSSIEYPSVLYSVCLRTFITNDFMTGVPAYPGVNIESELLDKMVMRLTTEVPFISRVLYDLTGKPPGTTEWE